MDSKKEKDLIKGCRRNNRGAQNELYQYYQGLVISISRRYGNSSENSEDVFQESFIEIFKSLAKNKQEIKNLDHWIARIAINTSISYYRKIKKHVFATNEYPDVLDENHENILDTLSNKELLEVIGRIPEGYRIVFNLFFIDGYTHKEIAETLGITVSTSRSQLVRAKQYLKNELESIGIYNYEAS